MATELGTRESQSAVTLGSKKRVDVLPNGRRLLGAEQSNLEEFARLKKADPDTILEADDFVSH